MPPKVPSAGPVFRVQVAERVQLLDQDAATVIKDVLSDVLGQHLAQKQVVVADLPVFRK